VTWLALLLAAAQDEDRPLFKTAYRPVNVHAHGASPREEVFKAEIEVLDRVGIGTVVVLDGGRSDGNLPAWMDLRGKYPGRLAVFLKADFRGIREPGFFDNLVRELEAAAKLGVQGVKVWKDVGMYVRDADGRLLKLDDPRLEPFFRRCGELGLPVLIHAADPREYWHPLTPNALHYGQRSEHNQHHKNPEMPPWEELIRQRDEVVRRHPRTTFIGAHLGSMTFDLQGLADRLDRFPNLFVECAARLRILGRLNPKAVRDFFVKYQDRVLFGTDGGILSGGRKTGKGNITAYPSEDPDWIQIDPADAAAVRRWQEKQARFYSRYLEYFETDRIDLVEPYGFGAGWMRISGVKLPPDVLEKFYRRNAERLIPGLAQEAVEVEGQPLAANARRVLEALEYLGRPLAAAAAVREAGNDARRVQQELDPHVVFHVTLGAAGKASVGRGTPALQQAGWTPVLVKVVNEAGSTKALEVSSPQAGPVYGGVAELSMQRQGQTHLLVRDKARDPGRFLDVEMFRASPMTPALSGLKVEYAIALLYSSEAGRREATVAFNGAAAPVVFDVRPAVPVRLSIRDVDGTPTAARLTFVDRLGHVYPPQPKRLAPDLFFQKQIYRHDGQTVLLPPGELTLFSSRGPEYRTVERKVTVPDGGEFGLDVPLARWVNPRDWGFYGGDHHIHAAGCAHYSSPTEGVHAPDMFLQVKGEGLNVGCILTWGPCFDYQKQFFSPRPDKLSEPFTLLKYDVEVSGFGSAALGHVCLLNLREQQYPGTEGTKGWPTWTTPVLRWAKGQGAVTGYAHSASGLQIVPENAGKRLLAQLDRDRDGRLSAAEAAAGLLPEDFAAADADGDGALTEPELVRSADRAADRLPNVAVPEMNSVGAMEIFVTVPQGLCDFISAMDTERLPEWNAWYHLMNCGFPLRVSGETDFPCMSGTRVGQGRVYVNLGRVGAIDYSAWCEGLARGRSYVSDGYAHALDFRVDGKGPGEELRLERPGTVYVAACVAFSPETPLEVRYGGLVPPEGLRAVGDTRILRTGAPAGASARRVELVVNGRVAAAREVAADFFGQVTFPATPIERSSWVAVRHFPQLHTNPVNVIVAGKPIRASRKSALWAIACIEQLWRVRGQGIAPAERDAARRAFDAAIEVYRRIAAESPDE
jgi:predicted TIM-barrel fold metal-dependent hydrolase